MVISNQRLDLAKKQLIGKASKLEVLNAQVDLNTDKVNLLHNRNRILIQRRNEILSRPVTTDFTVVETITIDNQYYLN
jgi:hypothetical protein